MAGAYVALALSPSSYGFALRIFGVTHPHTYLGSPREERWDEWAVQTPYIQAIVRMKFAAHNATSFYDEPFRNAISLPVRDWGLIFRPLFWGYLFLPPAWAFSLYWGTAAGLTLVGWSLLLRRVGVTYLLAIAASLAIFFNPFTQAWWTGIAPLFALFPWILLAFAARGRPRYLALPIAWLVGSWIVSSAYLPGLTLLGFAGAVFLIAFVVRRVDLVRLVVLALAALAGAAAGILYLAPVLRQLGSTVYPGHRVIPGGSLPLAQWLSQVTPFGVSRGYRPVISINFPESVAMGSWLPVLALALVDYRRIITGAPRQYIRPLAVLLAGFLLLTGWQLVSFLHWVGAVFLWNRSTEPRSLIASGLLLTVAAAWVLSAFPLRINSQRLSAFLILMLGATSVAALAIGDPARRLSTLEFYAHDNLVAILVSGLLVFACLGIRRQRGPRMAGGFVALAAVMPSVAGWALYNPVQDSRPIFRPIVTPITRELDQAAAARPDRAIAANFPGATLNGLGYRSVTHVLALPQIDVFARLFPDLGRERLNFLFDRYLELFVFDGPEPELSGEGTISLPRTTVSRIATVSPVTAYPLPTFP